MRKLTILFALLTLSVGMTQAQESATEAIINAINNTADDIITVIQNASTADVAKPIQKKAINDINDVREFAIYEIRDLGNDPTIIKDGVLHEFNSIKTFAILKIDVIKQIQTAGQGIQNTNINNRINGAITDIQSADTDTDEKVDDIKNQILMIINIFQDGKSEALGTMGTKQDGPAIEVSDGTTTVTLYNPKNVQFKKIQKEQ